MLNQIIGWIFHLFSFLLDISEISPNFHCLSLIVLCFFSFSATWGVLKPISGLYKFCIYLPWWWYMHLQRHILFKKTTKTQGERAFSPFLSLSRCTTFTVCSKILNIFKRMADRQKLMSEFLYFFPVMQQKYLSCAKINEASSGRNGRVFLVLEPLQFPTVTRNGWTNALPQHLTFFNIDIISKYDISYGSSRSDVIIPRTWFMEEDNYFARGLSIDLFSINVRSMKIGFKCDMQLSCSSTSA